MVTSVSAPSEEHLSEVLRWLKEEEDASDSGFYNNRETIAKLFREGKAWCTLEGGKAVAFIVFSEPRRSSELFIMEVHPGRRGQGFGRKLVEFTLAHLAALEVETVHIECNPKTSVPFWRSLGFVDTNDEQNYPNTFSSVHLKKRLQ